jgi:cysteine desulfuration protein SufE
MKEKSMHDTQEEIIAEFSVFDNWMDKYNYLIEMSRDLPMIDPKFKTKEHLIEACQSRVWLYAGLEDGKIRFSTDSDAIITKGIIALLLRVLNNRSPEEILNEELYFIDRIGLKENLSPTRSNGLVSMIKQIKMYALAYQTRMEK